MAISQVILVGMIGGVMLALVALVLVLYFRKGQRKEKVPWGPSTPGLLNKIGKGLDWRRIPLGTTTWPSLYRKVGMKSKVAGLGFAALTSFLLVLSYLTQIVLFEIDSVVAFLATLVLLFSEPRRKVHASMIDAILISNEISFTELASKLSDAFEYIPGSGGVSGVMLRPSKGLGSIALVGSESSQITPAGQGLAELFLRESGIKNLSFESLEVSLPQIVTEHFGLASSVMLTRNDDSVSVVLGRPSFKCPCPEQGIAGKFGVPGCTIGSFVAVLVCASEGRPLELSGCRRNGSAALEISMRLRPKEESP